MEMCFPGEIIIKSQYLLNSDNKLVMKWEASMNTEGIQTPINICNHAYWNLSGDFKDSKID